MLKLKAISKNTGLAILLSTMLIAPGAYANDVSEAEARLEALSYAPEGSLNDERFSQFEFEQSEDYAEHELNDSWLGMPAYSSSGTLIGYIENAILDEEGYATQIIVGLHSNQAVIEIKGEFAELTDEKVQFELSNKQIAALAGTNKLASLAE